MSHELLLVIFAIVVLVIIYVVRRVLVEPPKPRTEAALRIGLCILLAFIAFVIYHTLKDVWDGLAILSSALIIYAVTHLLDRFAFKGNSADPNRGI